jgi:predicted Zn-dependent peptidase
MKNECTRKTLDCGTVVLTEPMPHLFTACIGFWINFGSRNEPEDMYGAAHFIEHMLFKGTAKMGPRDLAIAIESLGGSIGAAASEEKTYSYARAMPEHMPVALDILSDMFFRSEFPEHEFKLEKEVVLEEIKGHDDVPEEVAFDDFLEDIYGLPGLGHSVLGYEKTVRELTRDKLYALYKKFYRPAHLIVTVAGNIGDMDVAGMIENALGTAAEERCDVMKPAQATSNFAHRVALNKRKTAQVHFTLGAPGVKYGDPAHYVYTLLDVILSGGMSSRLFQEVRERRGLVYDISTMNSCFTDTGFFSVNASTRLENLLEVVTVTAQELRKVKDGDITQEELSRVKEQLRVSIAMSFESVSTRMSKLARSEIYYGRMLSDEEIFDMITSITLDDLSKAANDLFKGPHFVFSALGPFTAKKSKDLEKRISEIVLGI